MSKPIYDANQGGFRVFIGNLSSRISESSLRKECERHGPVVDCWVARNPPGFAFVLFKRGEDAVSAVLHMGGCDLDGQRIRVEHAKARSVYPRHSKIHGSHQSRSRSRSRSSSRGHSKMKIRSSRHRNDDNERNSRRKDRHHSHKLSDSNDSSIDHDKRHSCRRRKRQSSSDDDRASKHSSSSSIVDDSDKDDKNRKRKQQKSKKKKSGDESDTSSQNNNEQLIESNLKSNIDNANKQENDSKHPHDRSEIQT